MMMGAEIKIIKSGWPVVSGAFDLWSYATFPGESAHRRDLGESSLSDSGGRCHPESGGWHKVAVGVENAGSALLDGFS